MNFDVAKNDQYTIEQKIHEMAPSSDYKATVIIVINNVARIEIHSNRNRYKDQLISSNAHLIRELGDHDNDQKQLGPKYTYGEYTC